jgi:hypothetical protein
MQYKGGENQNFGYGGYYGINNILGTFIASELRYRNNYRSEFFRTRWEKPFVTTNTKFGGEIMYENLAENRLPIYNYPDSIFVNDDFYRINNFDIWSGYSFVNKDLTKPFINIAGRFYLGNFTTRPEIDPETNYPFHDRNLYLASVSLQKIKYIKTTKLLQFGIIEDVPIGINMNLTGGWEKTSFYERPYLGMMLNYSKYFQNAGIFSSQTEIGGYRYDSDFEDVFAGVRFNYFSPLSNFGRFELRNILETSYISALNRRYLFPVHFGEGKGGLDRLEIFGETALEFRYRSVFYTPYKAGGFKFSIGPFVDLGWITRMESFQGDKDFFAVYGITTSTKNESLIFPAMHLHVGYSPNWIDDDYKIEFKIVFKDYKLFNKFTSLQPKTANPTNFY